MIEQLIHIAGMIDKKILAIHDDLFPVDDVEEFEQIFWS